MLGGFPTRVLDAKKAYVERYGMEQNFWTLNSRESNTAAVAQMAQATMQLISYMADEDAEEEAGGGLYMDGSKIED